MTIYEQKQQMFVKKKNQNRKKTGNNPDFC